MVSFIDFIISDQLDFSFIIPVWLHASLLAVTLPISVLFLELKVLKFQMSLPWVSCLPSASHWHRHGHAVHFRYVFITLTQTIHTYMRDSK